MQNEGETETLLLGSSLDRLVRLFDIGIPYGNGQRRRGKEICSYFTGLENAISMATEASTVILPSQKSEEDADEEKVWAGMAIADEQNEIQEEDEESSEVDSEKHTKKRRA